MGNFDERQWGISASAVTAHLTAHSTLRDIEHRLIEREGDPNDRSLEMGSGTYHFQITVKLAESSFFLTSPKFRGRPLTTTMERFD